MFCSPVFTQVCSQTEGFTTESAGVRLQLVVDSLDWMMVIGVTFLSEVTITASIIAQERSFGEMNGLCVCFHVSS